MLEGDEGETLALHFRSLSLPPPRFESDRNLILSLPDFDFIGDFVCERLAVDCGGRERTCWGRRWVLAGEGVGEKIGGKEGIRAWWE